MHFLINVIVRADNRAEALQAAQDGADTMTDQEYGADFDWYAMDGRWGEAKAHKVTSLKGAQLLTNGMESTRKEFNGALKAVRYMLENYSDEDIFNENFGTWEEIKDKLPEDVFSLSRWQFGRAGGYGNCCYVYAPVGDLWGGKVENQKDLEHILETNDKLWVVPIDFHN